MRRKQGSIIVLVFISFLVTSTLFTNCTSQFQSASEAAIKNSNVSLVDLTNMTDLLLITQRPSTLTNKSNDTLRYSIKPGKENLVDSVEAQINAGEWQVVYDNEIIFTDLAYGNQKISLRAVSKDGSRSQSIEYRWFVDNLKPVVVINSAPAAQISADSQIVFSSPEQSAIIATICTINLQTIPGCQSPINLNNMVNGANYEVKIQFTDSAGNISDPATINFQFILLDIKSVALNLPPAPVNANSQSQFQFASTGTGEELVSYECSFDASPFSPCTSGVLSPEYSVDGVHQFRVRGLDAMGRYSAVVSYSWEVDFTPPVVTFASPFNQCVNTPSTPLPSGCSASFSNSIPNHVVAFSVSDKNPGTIECQLTRNAGEIVTNYTPCTSPIDLSDHSRGVGGRYELRVRAKDVTNNQTVSITNYRLAEGPASFMSMNFSGGIAFTRNILVRDINSQRLADGAYQSFFAMDTTLSPFVETAMGMDWYVNSGILAGMKNVLGIDINSPFVRAFAIASRTNADTNTNRHLANGMIEKIGLKGKYASMLTTSASTNIGGQFAVVAPATMTELYNTNDLTSLFGISPLNIGNFNIDVRNNYALAPIWGVDTTTASNTALAIRGTAVLSALSGASVSSHLTFGGYDYDGAAASAVYAKDLDAGENIGRTIKTAISMNRKLILYLTTDGSFNDSQNSLQLFFVIDPTNSFNYGNYMIGSFNNNTVALSSVGSEDVEKIPAIVACNYAVFSGLGDCSTAINIKLTADEIMETKVITPK